MTKFLRNIAAFFILPLLLYVVIECVLSPTLFTFRTWEALYVKTPLAQRLLLGPFYPNIECERFEEGDLAHHTDYAINKDVSWKTDPIGYRNTHYISSPDILLIGDSNIAGSSLSQQETLASLLEDYTGLSVYNLAPASINTFITYKNEGIFHPPKIVILSSIERNIPSLPYSNASLKYNGLAQARLNSLASFCAIQIDKLIRANSIEYCKARIRGSGGGGIQSTIDKRVFFLQGSNAVINTSHDAIESCAERINGYKDYFNSIGTQFIFLPIPNKETIVWELAGLKKQPTFIEQLTDKLRVNNISTIEMVTLFNRLQEAGISPYHYDDTHWNKYANDAVAKTITRYLKSTKILEMKESTKDFVTQ
jgi:SGNH hydrolase-like domain, acetyltransferase AlgX